MPLDPFLQAVLPTLPPMPAHIEDYPAMRAEQNALADGLIDQLTEPGPEGCAARRVTIDVESGQIDLLIYTPSTPGPHPAHVYLHGGGWIAGTIDVKTVDITCRERSVGADCVVISVDYRKAPEHPFPVGLHDCYTALKWVVNNAEQLGVRAELISIGGGSAGANLAAAVTLMSRDDGPVIAFQLLEVPALDLTLSQPSHTALGEGYQLTRVGIEACLDAYLSSPDDARNRLASPLLCDDLTGLPPAHIMSAEFDPLRDDGDSYHRRLREAGVPATFSLGLGHIHISPAATKVMVAARQWRDEVVDVLRQVNSGKREAS